EAAAEAGELRLDVRRCEVAWLVDSTQELLEPIARVRGMRLAVDLPAGLPPIEVDAMRLQQVLFNLVGNALKYAPDGTTVELRAAATAGHVRFEVRDQG